MGRYGLHATIGDCFVTECDLVLLSVVVASDVMCEARGEFVEAGTPIGHMDMVATVGCRGNYNRTSHGLGLSVSVYKFNEHAFYVDACCV